MRRPELTIPTILGILLTVGGLATGLWLLREPIRGLVGAAPEEAPTEVKITNISDTGFAVSWVTGKAAAGYVQYGEAVKGEPDLVVSDDRDQEKGAIGSYFTHLVTVRGLKATTKYTFRIGSGRTLYDQQGQVYETTTGVALTRPPAADVAYGQVTTPAGDPAEGAIVYLVLPGVVPQAALVKSSGSWVIPISTARTTDLTSFAAYDAQNGQMEIMAQAGPMGTATVRTTTANDSPVPVITLGQTKDYVIQAGEPEVAATDAASKFSAGAFDPASEATGAGTLTILTPKSGERVNTDQPEIMGRAPAGARVTITVESPQTYTTTLTADKSGEWTYSVPGNLEPGEHTITVSTVVAGIVKKVTRSFVVQAAGESSVPAKTATPSAPIKPAPPPKPTPTPPVRVSIPSTESGVPTSGNLTPTLILLILGAGLVITGGLSYKKYT